MTKPYYGPCLHNSKDGATAAVPRDTDPTFAPRRTKLKRRIGLWINYQKCKNAQRAIIAKGTPWNDDTYITTSSTQSGTEPQNVHAQQASTDTTRPFWAGGYQNLQLMQANQEQGSNVMFTMYKTLKDSILMDSGLSDHVFCNKKLLQHL